MDVDHEASEMDVDLPLANIPRARCICGSNTHSRRTHRNCPLNNNSGNGQRNNQYLNIARQIERLPERHFLVIQRWYPLLSFIVASRKIRRRIIQSEISNCVVV
jgi:hypothetical protein